MGNNQFKKNIVILLTLFGLWALSSSSVSAHCQIPCGIYDDHARIGLMLEDSRTILKATKVIKELSGKTDDQSHNQRVRWIMNKEKHAQNIISTICDYFLTQRVKVSQKDYLNRLALHHAVIVAAMKAKQNIGEDFALALEKSLRELAVYYPEGN